MVYVGGNRGTDYKLKRVRAINSGSEVRGGPEYLVDGNNSYLNQQGLWTMGLLVRAPFGTFGSSTYTFEIGDDDFNPSHSTLATIQLISSRDYTIEYSCMGSTYDLRTSGYQFVSKVTEAYACAGTPGGCQGNCPDTVEYHIRAVDNTSKYSVYSDPESKTYYYFKQATGEVQTESQDNLSFR